MRDALIPLVVLDVALAALSDWAHFLEHFRLSDLPHLDLRLAAPRRDLRAPNRLDFLVRHHLRHHNGHVVVVDSLADIRALQGITDDGHLFVGLCRLVSQRGEDAAHHNHPLSHDDNLLLRS